MSGRFQHRTARRIALAAAAGALAVVSVAMVATPVSAQTEAEPPAEVPAAPTVDTTAAAYIAVDVATGEVLAQQNAHEPLRPASVTKTVTALAVRRTLSLSSPVVVSERAAAMPAKKLNLVPGSVWTVEQLLHGLLMPSANDVALALAEGAGAGSAEAFSGPLQQVATELGMTDNPTLVDPSGLDDAYSVNGGNYISAHDLAIAGRALLSDPFLAQIVSTQSFSFVDPTGLERRLVNGNKMLANYPGAVGVKTGYTRAAGRTLMTAATRDNRTILTVVLNAPDMYGLSTLLLDNGFATPSGVNAGAEFLPPIPLSYRPIGARLATWPGLVGAATAQPVATTTVPPTTAATAVTTAVAAAADVATDSTGATSPQSDTPEVVGANADAGSDALPQWLRVVAVVLVVVLSLRLRVLLLRRRRRHKRAHIAIDRKIDSDEAATRRHVRRASVPVHDTINSRSTPPTPAAPEVHEERIDESSVVVVVDGVDDPAAFEVAPTYRRTSIRAPRR